MSQTFKILHIPSGQFLLNLDCHGIATWSGITPKELIEIIVHRSNDDDVEYNFSRQRLYKSNITYKVTTSEFEAIFLEEDDYGN